MISNPIFFWQKLSKYLMYLSALCFVACSAHEGEKSAKDGRRNFGSVTPENKNIQVEDLSQISESHDPSAEDSVDSGLAVSTTNTNTSPSARRTGSARASIVDIFSGFKPFIDYCSDANASEAIKVTVKALWDYVDATKVKREEEKAKDCKEVSDFLEAMDGRSILTLTREKDAKPITDLAPLARLINIKKMRFTGHSLTDLRLIAANKDLLELSISHNEGYLDIRSLSGHKSLKTLFLGVPLDYRQDIDVTVIASLSKLESLGFDAIYINDYSWLADKNQLKELTINNQSLDNQGIHNTLVQENVSALSRLANLKELTLSSNELTDISALKSLLTLEKLDLSKNAIVDISSLASLALLAKVDLSQNNIVDFSPLENLTLLDKKSDLNLKENPGLDEKTEATCPVDAAAKGLVEICSK